MEWEITEPVMQKAKCHQSHSREVFNHAFADSPLAHSPRLIQRRSFMELGWAVSFDSRAAPAARPASLEREVINETWSRWRGVGLGLPAPSEDFLLSSVLRGRNVFAFSNHSRTIAKSMFFFPICAQSGLKATGIISWLLPKYTPHRIRPEHDIWSVVVYRESLLGNNLLRFPSIHPSIKNQSEGRIRLANALELALVSVPVFCWRQHESQQLLLSCQTFKKP